MGMKKRISAFRGAVSRTSHRIVNRRSVAWGLVSAGGLVTAIGIGLIYLPFGVIFAGAGTVALGLIAVNIPDRSA